MKLGSIVLQWTAASLLAILAATSMTSALTGRDLDVQTLLVQGQSNHEMLCCSANDTIERLTNTGI